MYTVNKISSTKDAHNPNNLVAGINRNPQTSNSVTGKATEIKLATFLIMSIWASTAWKCCRSINLLMAAYTNKKISIPQIISGIFFCIIHVFKETNIVNW